MHSFFKTKSACILPGNTRRCRTLHTISSTTDTLLRTNHTVRFHAMELFEFWPVALQSICTRTDKCKYMHSFFKKKKKKAYVPARESTPLPNTVHIRSLRLLRKRTVYLCGSPLHVGLHALLKTIYKEYHTHDFPFPSPLRTHASTQNAYMSMHPKSQYAQKQSAPTTCADLRMLTNTHTQTEKERPAHASTMYTRTREFSRIFKHTRTHKTHYKYAHTHAHTKGQTRKHKCTCTCTADIEMHAWFVFADSILTKCTYLTWPAPMLRGRR